MCLYHTIKAPNCHGLRGKWQKSDRKKRNSKGKSVKSGKVECRSKVCYTPKERKRCEKEEEKDVVRMKDGNERYFEAALSDFVFDVAAGGAIRHLTDRGYSVEQIMRELSYPVPRIKVEKAVYRHLTDSRMLLSTLPEENGSLRITCLRGEKGEGFSRKLAEAIAESGEENAYMECPFGIWMEKDERRFAQTIACLTNREQEYLLGIRWAQHMMYHRLNDRMREIGMKLVKNTEWVWNFFFIR